MLGSRDMGYLSAGVNCSWTGHYLILSHPNGSLDGTMKDAATHQWRPSLATQGKHTTENLLAFTWQPFFGMDRKDESNLPF